MTEHTTCCHCGQIISGTPVMVGNDSLCECCAEEETTLCSRCGERIYRHDNAGDEETPLCQHCYENHYYRCDRCGRIIYDGDAYYASDDEDQNYRFAMPAIPAEIVTGRFRTITTSRNRYSVEMAPGILAWSWRLTGPGRIIPVPVRSWRSPTATAWKISTVSMTVLWTLNYVQLNIICLMYS